MVRRRIGWWLGAAAVLSLSAIGAARAGDAAQANVLGFSADGRYVAFEQHGIQDGSGFPYSDLFVIDLAADDWVEGTPVRVELEDETADPAQARKAARQQASAVLKRTGIDSGVAGRVLLRHELTDGGVDPRTARFRLHWHGTLAYELKLEEREVAAPDCPEDFGPFKVYDLVLLYPDGRQRLLHEDKSLPKSRGCPLRYGIAEVWFYEPDYDAPAETPPSLLVLLHMQLPGFEGPDVRYMAVGLRPADLEAF